MKLKPHLSPALWQVRRWVFLLSSVFALAVIAQLGLFAMVHYTDLRWEPVATDESTAPLRVVQPDAPKQIENGRVIVKQEVIEAPRVPSETGVAMSRVGSVTAAVGPVAGITLAVVIMLGVVIAAGGAVPGVERTVTAFTWVVVLAAFCIPWTTTLPAVQVPAIFSSYNTLVDASQAVRDSGAGSWRLLIGYVAIPTISLLLTVAIAYWFKTGTDRGVIVTAVSQLDSVLEREIAGIRDAGVSAAQPKTIGALYRAVGDVPGSAGEPEPVSPLRFQPPPPDPAPMRSMKQGSPGDPLKRPI